MSVVSRIRFEVFLRSWGERLGELTSRGVYFRRVRPLGLYLVAALGLTCSVLIAGPSAAPVSAFRAGDRWTAVGDSITQYGSYYAWIYLYHVTRFPDRPLTVSNCGISGDSARGAVKRYDWDIKPTRPTVASIMLGMNDVSRDLYGENPPTPVNLQNREAALTGYRENVTQLASLLQRDGARLVFITPSPFDETVEVATPRLTGVNGALGECAKFLRELAAAKGAAVIDLHAQMTELNARLQKTDPKFTLIGADRVHPATAGHLVMAYFFLRAQGAPATVSRIVIDASSRATQADNATLENLVVTRRTISFACTEHALPYPIPDDGTPALAWIPFQQDLNQETLQVVGLDAGTYALSIDDEPIGSFSAGQLATGVNLAECPATPQNHQAREVLTRVQEWQQIVAHRQRIIAEVEFWRLPDLPRPIDLNTARPLLREFLESLKATPGHRADFDRGNVERYFTAKPHEAETNARLNQLETEIRALAVPRSHRYRIVGITDGNRES